MARYIERAESVARIMEVNTSFQRGRGPSDDAWSWMVTLYSDETAFAKLHDQRSAANVIEFYATQHGNLGSIQSSIRAARENARALRPLISTDMWYQVNDFHTRLLGLGASDFSEMRLSRTCDSIKRGCYAQMGVAETTLYRDEIWPFFRLGLFVERADQMSRLLDVKFAQLATGVRKDPAEFNFTFWATLLRSASGYHAFRRIHPADVEAEDVARFLLFDTGLPRSISYCAGEMRSMIALLEEGFHLPRAAAARAQVEGLLAALVKAAGDGGLIDQLHDFNDWIQLKLAALTNELGYAFFGNPPPVEQPKAMAQSQTQAQL
jgi:uncharacterized alpha-E superfamily protein